MRWLALAVLVVANPSLAEPLPSPGCARQTIAHGARLERTIDVGGAGRQVILDVPESVRPGAPAPLLLDFHGFGHSGAGVWQVSAFKPLAKARGFITAYPEGLPIELTLRGEKMQGAGWQMDRLDDNRDVAFTAALLDQVERDYCIDRRRIYSTGFSNGAYFSQVLACALPQRIAAVAPVSGGNLRIDCAPSRPVPILIQHGSEDDLIPATFARAARDRWKAINGCQGDAHTGGTACQRWTDCNAAAVVEYCEEPYAHRWPPQATERVWEFLSAKSLP